MIRALPLVAVLALTACGGNQIPTRATAERLCAPEARVADGFAGNVGVGGGSGGASASGSFTITSDILNPRNEQDALRDCVNRRLSGDNSAPRQAAVGITLGGQSL